MAPTTTERVERRTPRRLAAAATLAIAVMCVLGGPAAQATPPTAVVYDAIPSPLPFNVPSQPFQAQQVTEFGDYVHLGGSNRKLRTVTVAMSDFAIQTTPANVAWCAGHACSSAGFDYPITLNIYGAVAGSPNTRSLPAIATVTQTFTIPWRPAADPSCPFSSGAFGWRASDHNCYNGFLSTITFDLTSQNVTLPNDVVVAVAYNTQSYGAVPTGVDGPYNSLNVGSSGAATVGTDDNVDRTFLNSGNASFYGDHGAGGVGTLREDIGWGSTGSIPIEITAAPSTPSDVYVSPTFTGSGDPDGAGPASSVGYDAFATIQAGIDAVAAGGTVHVEAGTYAESPAVGKSLTLDGGSHAATLVGSIGVNADNVTVNGFTLTNPSGTEAVRLNGVSNAQITNNDIHDIGGTGSTVNATGAVQAIYIRAGASDVNGIVVTGNTISHVRSSGAGSGKSIKAIFVGDSNGANNVGVTITGNTITDVVSSGWGAYGILANHATNGAGSSTVDIEQNSIANITGTFAHAIGLEGDTPNSKVIGNTISAVVDSTPASPDAEAIKLESNPHAAQVTISGNNWGTGVPLGIVVDGATAPGTISAAGNWWGSFTAADVQAKTSGSVTTGPWCVDAACAALSNDAGLTSLSLSSGTLSPAFGSATTSYAATVGDTVTAVSVAATARPGAAFTVAGAGTLQTGANMVTVTATSADSTRKTYTIVVTRNAAPLSGNADLASLSVSAGALSPGFSSATTSYSVSVDNAVTSLGVSATAAGPGASVAVNGGSSLGVGANTVTIGVTAANGTVKTTTITVNRAAAPVVGEASVVQAAPEQSGVASVVVAQAAAAGATTPPPVAVNVSWPAQTFAVPVEVKLAPQAAPAAPAGSFAPPPQPTPVAGGFSVGTTVVQLTITDTTTGAPITSFQQPLTIHLSASEAGDTPAYSHDGVTWTTIPRLGSPELPAGQQDGYFLNADRSVDIYTRHATLFGLLTDAQAPTKPMLIAHLASGKLYLSLRGAKDNVRVAGYRLLRNGRVLKNTVHAYVVLPALVGKYTVVALDAAGNKSKASTIAVVRTAARKHPLGLTQ